MKSSKQPIDNKKYEQFVRVALVVQKCFPRILKTTDKENTTIKVKLEDGVKAHVSYILALNEYFEKHRNDLQLKIFTFFLLMMFSYIFLFLCINM